MMLEADTDPDIVSALIMNALRIDDEHRLMVVEKVIQSLCAKSLGGIHDTVLKEQFSRYASNKKQN